MTWLETCRSYLLAYSTADIDSALQLVSDDIEYKGTSGLIVRGKKELETLFMFEMPFNIISWAYNNRTVFIEGQYKFNGSINNMVFIFEITDFGLINKIREYQC